MAPPPTGCIIINRVLHLHLLLLHMVRLGLSLRLKLVHVRLSTTAPSPPHAPTRSTFFYISLSLLSSGRSSYGRSVVPKAVQVVHFWNMQHHKCIQLTTIKKSKKTTHAIEVQIIFTEHEQFSSINIIRTGSVTRGKNATQTLRNWRNEILLCVCCSKMLETWCFWEKKPSKITQC